MHSFSHSLRAFAARIAVVLLVIGSAFSPEQALAVSSWNPTLLVNTEAFQEIDDGDGTTNIELRFGSSTQTIKFLTTSKFQFSHAISVLGTISGSTLNVDRGATIGGSLSVTGSTTILGNGTVKGTLSGSRLRVSAGGADIQGALNVTGSILTEGDITLGGDDAAANVVVNFMNSGTDETLTWLDTLDKFQFSDDVSVVGHLSGSTLRVDGATEIHGTLAASGAVRTDNNLTINDDQTAADAVFTFGSDGTNETLTFLNTADKFQFSDDVSVVGTLSGSILRVDGNADINGSLSVTGSILTEGDITLGGDDAAANVVVNFMNSGTDETLTWLDTLDKFQFSDDVSVVGHLSGSTLRVDGATEIHGTLAASGAVRTDNNLTINDDQTAADAVFTFGSDGTNETLTFLNTADKFQFSDDVSIVGQISGSSLKIDGAAAISGSLVVQNSITSRGSLSGATFYGAGLGTCTGAGQAVRYDVSTGKFSCGSVSGVSGFGSGGILSLHAEFPNAVYFASGSNSIGQLTLSGGTSGLNNSYVWTSSRTNIQDYWTSVRVRLPDNFSSWDVVKPLELRYKTGSGGDANYANFNHVTVRLRDTAGALVPLTGASALQSATWATANITGPEGSGTWTPKGYFTVYIKHAANNATGTWGTANAAVSFLNLNFEQSVP